MVKLKLFNLKKILYYKYNIYKNIILIYNFYNKNKNRQILKLDLCFSYIFLFKFKRGKKKY